ncbi:MAG: hypothetical protein SVM79_06575, partial [Chloroflexota bacterium]|nr:hypothetical protein [Chloroflexota bacterium]
MKKWFIGLLLITLTLGCIACAEDANQDNPTNKTESLRDNSSITTTNSELPSITAFTAPDSVPPINPMKFATTKEDIDQTFLKLFGETYYTTHTELASHYEPHDLNKLRQALADLAQITSWNYQVNYF